VQIVKKIGIIFVGCFAWARKSFAKVQNPKPCDSRNIEELKARLF